MCCSRRHAIFFPDGRCQLEKTGKFYLFLLFITSAENLLTSPLLHSSYSTSTQHSHVLAKVSPNQVEENDMFRILARYIGVFGNPENKDTNKIAMTAPVLSKTSSSKIAMTAPVLSNNDMSFVLPKKFKTKEDAPQPTDTRVELIDVPERMVAVKTFSGLVSMDQSETMANEFKAALEAQGFICKGKFTNLVLEFEHKLQLTRINFCSLLFSLFSLFVFFFDLLYLRRLDVGEIQSAVYVVVSSYKRNMDDS